MDRPSCQQLVPAETHFRRHSRNSSSTDKFKKDRHSRKTSSSRARRSSSVVLDGPTQKLYDLGLVFPEKPSRTTRKPSTSEPESPQSLISSASCDNCHPEVTFSQHPAFPHLAEAEARLLGLLLPTVTTTSPIDHALCSEVVVKSADDVAYFNDYSQRYSTQARTANDVFGTLFKRTTPRTASFTTTSTTTLPQFVLSPKSPLPLFGKGDKLSHPQESVNDEVRSSISFRVRAAGAVFHNRLARGDFDEKTEIAFFQRPNVLCDPERMGRDQIITDDDLYEGRKLPPLDYVRAAYIEASHARREGRQCRLVKPLVSFWHTKDHKAFFVTPEVPRLLSRGVRIPRLPALRLPAGLKDEEEEAAAATNAATDETARPVQPQQNSAVEQQEEIGRCDTADGADMMLRFIKRTQRSRRGSESSGADHNSNSSDHFSDAESLFVAKSPTHPPVLPDFDFVALSERDDDNALGLARMRSIARRYNDGKWQAMGGNQNSGGDVVSVVSTPSMDGVVTTVDNSEVASTAPFQKLPDDPATTTNVLATTEAQTSQADTCLQDSINSTKAREEHEFVSSSIDTAGSEHDRLIRVPTHGDSIAIRRKSTRLFSSKEPVTVARLPAPLELSLREETKESRGLPGLHNSRARDAGMNSAPLMLMPQTQPKEPIAGKAGDLSSVRQTESIVSSSNTAGVSDDDPSPVLGRFCHEEPHRANRKTTVTWPGQGLSFSETFGTATKSAQHDKHRQSTAGTSPRRMDDTGRHPVEFDTVNELRSAKQDVDQITVQSDMPLPMSGLHPELPVSTTSSDHGEAPVVPPRRRPINYNRPDLTDQRKSACIPPLFSPRIPSAPLPTRADLPTNTKIHDDDVDETTEESQVKPLITKGCKKLPAPLRVFSEPMPAGLRSDSRADRVISRSPLSPIEQTSQLVNDMIFDLMDGADRQADVLGHLEVEADVLRTEAGTLAVARPLQTPRRSPTYRLTPIKSVKPAESEEVRPKQAQQIPGTIEVRASTTTDFDNSADQGEHPVETPPVRSHQAMAPRVLNHGKSSNSLTSPHRRQNHMEEGSCIAATTTNSSHRGSLISTTGSGNSALNEHHLCSGGGGGSPTHSTNDGNYPYHSPSGARPRLWKEIPVFDKYQGTLIEQDARAAAAKEEAERMYREKRERKLAAKAERKELKRLRKLEDEEVKRQQQQWEKQQQLRTGSASSLSPVRFSTAASSLGLSSPSVARAGGGNEGAAEGVELEERDHVGDLSKDSESSPRKQLSLPALRSKTSIRVLAGMFGSSS